MGRLAVLPSLRLAIIQTCFLALRYQIVPFLISLVSPALRSCQSVHSTSRLSESRLRGRVVHCHG